MVVVVLVGVVAGDDLGSSPGACGGRDHGGSGDRDYDRRDRVCVHDGCM